MSIALCAADRTGPRAHRECQTDEHRDADLEVRADVLTELWPDDGELREHGIEDALLEIGMVLQDEWRMDDRTNKSGNSDKNP